MNTCDHPAYLPGDKGWKRPLVRPATFWAERNILLRLGERVVAIDPSGHALLTTCGEGTSTTRSISVAYLRAGQVIAFDGVNSEGSRTGS